MTYNEFVEKLASECKTTAVYHEDGFSMRLFEDTYLVGFHSAWNDRLTILSMSYRVYDQMVEDMKSDEKKLPLPVFAFTYRYGSRLCLFMEYKYHDATEMFSDIDDRDDYFYFMQYAYYDETHQAYCFRWEDDSDCCGNPKLPMGYGVYSEINHRVFVDDDYFGIRDSLIRMSGGGRIHHDVSNFSIEPIYMVNDPGFKLRFLVWKYAQENNKSNN